MLRTCAPSEILTRRDRAPFRRGEGGTFCPPPSISEIIIDRDLRFFSGGSYIFLEKINFSSHGGQTAPLLLFSGQPLNIKTAVERPILKINL